MAAVSVEKTGRAGCIYLLAHPYSGSTLLGLLLGAHSRMANLGEIQRLFWEPEKRLCGCGAPIRQCPYWSALLSRIAAKNHCPIAIRRDVHPLRRFPELLDIGLFVGRLGLLQALSGVHAGIRAQLAAARNSWNLYDAIASHLHVRYVVDTSKDISRMKLLQLTRPSHLKVIQLVRDGRGVVFSLKKREGGDIGYLARLWKRKNQMIRIFSAGLPKNAVLKLRYEDLCDCPSRALKSICEFLGLEYEVAMEGGLAADSHALPGNEMLFEKAKRLRKDEDWKQILTPEEQRLFFRIAGRLNRQLGYE